MPRTLKGGASALAVASLAFGSIGLKAAQIQGLTVTREDTSYVVHMRVTLDVGAQAAYAVFSDSANLSAVNPAVEIAYMTADKTALVTQVRVCAALFCKTLHQMQTMHYAGRADGGHMEAVVVPEQSDFKSGVATWDFAPSGAESTALAFDARVEPAFWIPPLIGPYLVERSMRQEAERTSAGIERLARAHIGLGAVTPASPGSAP